MIEIFKNGYYRQAGTGIDFKTIVDPLPLQSENYFLESIKAAEEIEANRSGKLHLLYSGGLDSEFMLSVFLHLGIDVIPTFIKLSPNYNNHDLEYALKFCQSKSINLKVVDIDLKWFIESGTMLDIARSTKASAYQYTTHAYVTGMLDGTVISAGNEPYVKVGPETLTWYVEEYEYDFSMINYYQDNGIYGTPAFMSYTPGQMISYLRSRRIQQLVLNLLPGKLGSISSKHIIYNENNDFFLRARPKYHGGEYLEKSELFNHPTFKDIQKIKETYCGIYQTEYHKFMSNVCEQ